VKIMDNNGNVWVYAHLDGTRDDPSGIGLEPGTKVVAGETKIGLCDQSGRSEGGAHLHLELRLGGEWGLKTCPDIKLGTNGNC